MDLRIIRTNLLRIALLQAALGTRLSVSGTASNAGHKASGVLAAVLLHGRALPNAATATYEALCFEGSDIFYHIKLVGKMWSQWQPFICKRCRNKRVRDMLQRDIRPVHGLAPELLKITTCGGLEEEKSSGNSCPADMESRDLWTTPTSHVSPS